jgi:hypothetical protein
MRLQDSARMERVIANLRPQAPCRPPQRSVRSLGERMTELCTPGISVAVIDNFEVAWAESFGIRKMRDRTAVQPQSRSRRGVERSRHLSWLRKCTAS